MRCLYSIILVVFAVSAYCSPHKVPQQLVTLNHCWTEQNDIDKLDYPAKTNLDAREWIKIHLRLVEQTLRARSTKHLTPQQRANRLTALDNLNSYWHTGSFPINDEYNYRTPIFIDKYDNFCAVGYLVKSTGNENVSRMIAAQTNLAYVREMNYPELNAWAKDYGFTVDELAWIQPSYVHSPKGFVLELGKGADNTIHELYVGNSGEHLYAGGLFQHVDGSISANGIAYITDTNSVYTWHSMGDGLKGTVHAITEFDNKLFAAGKFSQSGTVNMENVAYWDGTKWNKAGCLDGVVKDLAVFKNDLYACGDFDICDGSTDVNFAKWNGTSWQGISGLTGNVNVMYVNSTELILGGLFDYDNNNVNIIKWYTQFGFVKYSNDIPNEVNDIQKHNGVFIVATKATTNASKMLYKSSGTALWIDVNYMWAFPNPTIPSYNTICVEGDTIWMGGDYYQFPTMTMGSSYQYTYSKDITFEVTENPYTANYNGFYIDGPINKMVVFKDALVGAGSFSKTYYGNMPLNNIFRRAKTSIIPPPPPPVPPYTGPPINDKHSERSTNNPGYIVADSTLNIIEGGLTGGQFSIYPNPASGSITVTNNFNAEYFKLSDLSGRVVITQKLEAGTISISLSGLAQGMYMAEIANAKGNKAMQKLVIQ